MPTSVNLSEETVSRGRIGNKLNFWRGATLWSWGIFIVSLFSPGSLQLEEQESFWRGVFSPFTTGFWEISFFPLALALLASGVLLLHDGATLKNTEMGRPRPLVGVLLFCLFWSIIGAWKHGMNLGSLWIFGHLGLLGLIFLALIRTPIPTRFLVRIFCLGALWTALFGISQVFMSVIMGPELPSGLAVLQSMHREILRASGPFTHPNILALVLGCAFFWSESWPGFWRLARAVFLSGIILTFSRTGLLGLLLGISFQYFAKRTSGLDKKNAMSKSTILLSLMLLLALFFRHIFDNASPSNDDRWAQILAALKMIGDASFFGVGLGKFSSMLPQYGDFLPWKLEPVHNLFLLIGSELGVLVAFSLIFLFWSLGKAIWRLRGRPNATALFGNFGLFVSFALFEHALLTSWVSGVCFALFGVFIWRELHLLPQNSK